MKILPIVLLATLAGCGSDSETVNTSLQDIVGVWDISYPDTTAENTETQNIEYLAIKANGELTSYDYQADALGSGEACYISSNEGVIEDLGEGNFKETDAELEITYYSIAVSADTFTTTYTEGEDTIAVTVNKSNLIESQLTPLCETSQPSEEEQEQEQEQEEEQEEQQAEFVTFQDIIGTWKSPLEDDSSEEEYTVIKANGHMIDYSYDSNFGNCYETFDSVMSTIEDLGQGNFKIRHLEKENDVYEEYSSQIVAIALSGNDLVFSGTENEVPYTQTSFASDILESDFMAALCEE